MNTTTELINEMVAIARKEVPHIDDFDARVAAYFVASHNYCGQGDPLYAVACQIDLNYHFPEGELHIHIPDAAFAYDAIAEHYGYPAYEPDWVDQQAEG